LKSAQAGWQSAGVGAAEVANLYYGARACALALTVPRDAASRAETSRLSELSAAAGFLAPATARRWHARAGRGANARATQQEAQCDLDVKALVALTGLAEADVRGSWSRHRRHCRRTRRWQSPRCPRRHWRSVGYYAAGREVAAASAEVGSAQAQRFPRLSLNGSVGVASLRSGGVTTDLTTWSIGPLCSTLPLFRRRQARGRRRRRAGVTTNCRQVPRQRPAGRARGRGSPGQSAQHRRARRRRRLPPTATSHRSQARRAATTPASPA
jgi:outer membrane protein TolC